jgi:chromosomal replication initiation ATPase DnaA
MVVPGFHPWLLRSKSAGGPKSRSRTVKMYLCRRYTGERLKNIDRHSGIGESGVSQAGRRAAQRVENDKQTKKRIAKISKKINLSRIKT